jgi:hypothetical protein
MVSWQMYVIYILLYSGLYLFPIYLSLRLSYFYETHRRHVGQMNPARKI